ncbi:hypothetical protein ACP70R_046417 [Stipagrostis hirtigluma subsp. patula]
MVLGITMLPRMDGLMQTAVGHRRSWISRRQGGGDEVPPRPPSCPPRLSLDFLLVDVSVGFSLFDSQSASSSTPRWLSFPTVTFFTQLSPAPAAIAPRAANPARLALTCAACCRGGAAAAAAVLDLFALDPALTRHEDVLRAAPYPSHAALRRAPRLRRRRNSSRDLRGARR